MDKRIVAVSLLFLLITGLWITKGVAKAESIRKGITLELKGGFFRPSDDYKWNKAFGRTFSGFGGLKLGQEIWKNIELGFSADYMHVNQKDWSVYIVPIGLDLTYALRHSQNQFLIPYLGGGVDFVYGRTSMIKSSDDEPSHLKEPGFHAIAGVRLLLDDMMPEDAFAFDNKFGVNNSYLTFEVKYLKLFDATYADQPLEVEGTGYLDPRGTFVSVGILVEF